MTHPSAISITHRLYRCRDTAKQMYGAGYQEMIAPFKLVIAKRMKDGGKSELLTLLDVAAEAQGKEHEGTITMLLMAAAVELIEENEKQKQNANE